jgi:hypothetical protein
MQGELPLVLQGVLHLHVALQASRFMKLPEDKVNPHNSGRQCNDKRAKRDPMQSNK